MKSRKLLLIVGSVVAVAMAGHISDRIVKIDSGVTVEVALPCDSQDRAIIRVLYNSDAQRDAIQAVLQDGGFGVPVELVRRT